MVRAGSLPSGDTITTTSDRIHRWQIRPPQKRVQALEKFDGSELAQKPTTDYEVHTRKLSL